MKHTDPAPWTRLERVINATHHTINSFARHIGLARGENLYQIKRGNNGISLDVAMRIHERYPEYSISWLMCGVEDSPIPSEADRTIIKIPLYRDLWRQDFDKESLKDEQLVISASVANGAQFAVPYMDDILNPYLRNSILLLRAQPDDKILSGNIYFVATKTTRMFRIVQEDERNPITLRLRTIHPSVFKDVLIPKSEIISMWLVCGAICKMER